MIVDSMNSQEIFLHLRDDFYGFIYSVMIRNKTNEYRKFKTKNRTRDIFPYKCKRIDFISKNKNRWHLNNFIVDKGDNKVYSSCYSTRVISGNGIIAYKMIGNFSPANNKLTHLFTFIPHLFQRYKERNNLELTGYELIEEFFIQNNSMIPSPYKYYDGDKDVVALCKNGMILGEYSDDTKTHIIFKTYISENEMDENQLLRYNIIKYSMDENLEKYISNIGDMMEYGLDKNMIRKIMVMFNFTASAFILPFSSETFDDMKFNNRYI